MNGLQFYASLLAANSPEKRMAVVDLHKVEICRKARAKALIADIVKLVKFDKEQN